ncbi:ATP-dependent RNA helicase RhlE domain protein [Bordetella bronchiseptica]|nr:ATP-dependent RNA helicase RhlE domain protein [Bordetella bronchiseptica]
MNAAVLPLPVCEETIRSAPAMAWGMAAACTEVGSVKPASLRAERIVGAKPKSSKDIAFPCRI